MIRLTKFVNMRLTLLTLSFNITRESSLIYTYSITQFFVFNLIKGPNNF